MTDYHHESKNLAYLFNCVFSGRVLEQGNEYVFKPICVKSVFFVINLENCQDTWVLELSESAFHKFEEFLFHLRTEDFVWFFVITQEKVFKVRWVKFINFLFDFGIHFFPELFMSAVQFFHQIVKLHNLCRSDKNEIFIDVFEGLIDPWMFVPVMFLLALHSWKVLKTCDDLLMSEQF